MLSGQWRITPACAGKTAEDLAKAMFETDHPRVCGENRNQYLLYSSIGGSPPRVRGKLHLGLCTAIAKRITPACAGKTRKSSFVSF